MEDLLYDVAEIQFAAQRAVEGIEKLDGAHEQLSWIMTLIANLAVDVESFLREYQVDKSAKLEIGFRRKEGIDPWSLFWRQAQIISAGQSQSTDTAERVCLCHQHHCH